MWNPLRPMRAFLTLNILSIGTVLLIECCRYFITQIRCPWINPSYIKSEVILIHHIVHITNFYTYLFDMKYLSQIDFIKNIFKIENLIWDTKNNILLCISNRIQRRYRLQNHSSNACDENCNLNGFSRCFRWTIFFGHFLGIFLKVFLDNFYEMILLDLWWQTFLADLKK